MESNSYYYFFSAMAQSFAALVGILAVFVVYALEWIQKSIEWSRDDFVRVLKPYDDDDNFPNYGLNTQVEAAEKKILPSLRGTLQGYSGSKFDTLKKVIDNAEKGIGTVHLQRKWRDEVTSKFKELFLKLLIIVAYALFMSPFGKILQDAKLFGVAILLFSFLPICYGLWQIRLFVQLALTRPRYQPNQVGA